MLKFLDFVALCCVFYCSLYCTGSPTLSLFFLCWGTCHSLPLIKCCARWLNSAGQGRIVRQWAREEVRREQGKQPGSAHVGSSFPTAMYRPLPACHTGRRLRAFSRALGGGGRELARRRDTGAFHQSEFCLYILRTHRVPKKNPLLPRSTKCVLGCCRQLHKSGVF